MGADSTDQTSADNADPNFGDLATDPTMAPDFNPSAPPTMAADLSGTSSLTSLTSSLSTIPLWAWLILGGAIVFKMVR